MNIVIVGAGNVGRALGSGWLKTGHKVTMAVREPSSSKAIELKKRILVPVHHRLRLLAFPMRTAVRESELSTDGQTWDIPGSNAIYLRVMCS